MSFKLKLKDILESPYFSFYITSLTLYALFADDIRVAAFDVNADYTFDVLTIISMSSFLIEICSSVYVNEGYFNSFFFWLDMISTVSMFLDIGMFTVTIGLNAGSAKNSASIARAGRASRLGTRAGRVVRLVRLIRIVKLYKATQKDNQKKDKRSSKNQINYINQEQEDQYENLQESKVSKQLSDLTTKRVIIIVLALLIIMPLFDAGYYSDPPQSLDYIISNLKYWMENSSNKEFFEWTKNQSINLHQSTYTPLTYLNTPIQSINYASSNYYNLRVTDLQLSYYVLNQSAFMSQNYSNETIQYVQNLYNNNGVANFTAALDISWVNQTTALFSIAKTIFVCIVLTLGAMMFSKDANDIALRPIERMIEKVKKIANNPRLAIEEKLIQNKKKDQYETIVIENAIIKIGTLLALGFGDAGSEIISQNMSNGGDVDPMIPGKKKCCIYGFCDIRNFTDATEILQEDVMIFVNNIGEIVHQMCDRYAGSANKNIGDAFLLVWKLQDNKYEILQHNQIKYLDQKYVQQLADCALITFLKTNAKMNREPKILKYREDDRLQKRIKNYKVKLGSGLHIGWSIEGAIGSEFKIDASYLSSSVNLSARLEGTTKAYGVPLLISEDLYNCFSNSVQKYARQVDNVLFKGAENNIGIYTIDIDLEKLPISKDTSNYNDLERRFILKNKKKRIESQLNDYSFSADDIFKKNKDLTIILRQWNLIFQEQYNVAFNLYIKGDWDQAEKKFQDVFKIAPNDGPSKSINDYMREFKFKCPDDWKGYRILID